MLKFFFFAVAVCSLGFLCPQAMLRADDTNLTSTRLADSNFTITNLEAMWPKQCGYTSNGWRFCLFFSDENYSDMNLIVLVGNNQGNPNAKYFWTPNETFQKFELKNSDGILLSLKSHFLVETNLPAVLPIKQFPRWSDGKLKNRMVFSSNGPPWVLKQFRFTNLYDITNEGDYTLSVCAVLYKLDVNSNAVMRRVILPCATNTIHLKSTIK